MSRSPAVTPADLAGHPNPIAGLYARFRVAERLLLTGHSHQAWPDTAFEAQERAWLDAAELVDDKWERAFAVADRVRSGILGLLEDPAGEVALGENTFELVARLLSALPLRDRPRLVTTDGEFHTIRRLLDRLEEEGLEVVRVPSLPVDSLAERLAAEVDDRTAAALVSKVLYESGHVVEGLARVADACALHGAELLVDAYHAVNILPFSVPKEGLERAFVVGGGYKYLQWGEGCCFLRFPKECTLRPMLTGWFSEFGLLGEEGTGAGVDPVRPLVGYGAGPARFSGSTYDPTAHYRAAAVLDHFAELGLDPSALRALSLHQVARIARRVADGDPNPARLHLDDGFRAEGRGGFVVLRSPHAAELVRRLREGGVFADARGTALRLGPAPYLSDPQLDDAVDRLLEAVRALG